MSILQHIHTKNIKAFNNMLRHTQQKGTERTYNKRAGKLTPVVQMLPRGGYNYFLAFNWNRSQTVIINHAGACVATLEYISISAATAQTKAKGRIQ